MWYSNVAIFSVERVSKLFISKEEADMISDLVIINPKWLIGIMQIIVELKDNCPLISGREQTKLKHGEVSLDVLKKLWGDSENGIPETKTVDPEKLAIVLQAYCLIHSCNSETSDTKCFITPSMLPSDLSNDKKQKLEHSDWIDFYFDFEKFLPVEVFHRLVCMLMAEVHKSDFHKCNLSQSLCSFPRICHCIWKVELKNLEHKIKVSVK